MFSVIVKIIVAFTVGISVGVGVLFLKGDLHLREQTSVAGTASNQKTKSAVSTRQVVIYIADMDCKTSKCAVKAREALQPIQGVRQVQVDGDAKTAILTVDRDCSEGALLASLRQAGFDDARIR